MILWLAFLTGLTGSFHCIGMCGPIALALPVGKDRQQLLFGRLAYNVGRILTYALLGLLFGLLGMGFQLGGWQQILSISIGVVLLLTVIWPKTFGGSNYMINQQVNAIAGKVRQTIAPYFKKTGITNMLMIGVINGFLPCGLVYLALAGALASGNAFDGMIYMEVFGLGTLPLMLVVSLAGNFISQRIRTAFFKMVPALTVLIACMFILRGLNLGIPYLSPAAEVDCHGQETMKCCKQGAYGIRP